jgi:thymidylate synthase
VIDGYLNLAWNQRSVDVCCGLPQNIASYGILLHLLAKEASLKEGKLIGFLMDTHIYSNHLDGIKKQLTQETYILPAIKTEKFTSIFDWTYEDTELLNYQSSGPIKFEVAI